MLSDAEFQLCSTSSGFKTGLGAGLVRQSVSGPLYSGGSFPSLPTTIKRAAGEFPAAVAALTIT